MSSVKRKKPSKLIHAIQNAIRFRKITKKQHGLQMLVLLCLHIQQQVSILKNGVQDKTTSWPLYKVLIVQICLLSPNLKLNRSTVCNLTYTDVVLKKYLKCMEHPPLLFPSINIIIKIKVQINNPDFNFIFFFFIKTIFVRNI